MSSGKVLASVLAGAAAGAIFGILFAPDKGSETRRRISTKSNDLTTSIKDKFGEFVDKFKNEMETAQDEAQNLVSTGKSVIEKL